MQRSASLLGALYMCDRCDAEDPIDDVKRWLGGELKPPAPASAADQ
jgi:hypothetical protein